MCGIVGYLGKKEASPILIKGLSTLEYRGYDSAGVAIMNEGHIDVQKCKGRLANLEKKLNENPIRGHVGIGHTRWATHGEPSDVNSHPHNSLDGKVSVVHNGIIENYLKLREWLQGKGYKFLSDTDTEVIPNLVEYYYEGDLLDAVMKATSKMEGSYAIGVMCDDEPEKIVAVRKDSPLIVGIGQGEYFIASDIPAVLPYTREVYLLNDKEFIVMENSGVSVYDEYKEPVNKEVYHVTWNADAAEKGGFKDFTLKEIHEQPKAVRDTLAGRIAPNKLISLDKISLTKKDLDEVSKIYIVACGTAYHAGVVGKYVIEKLARIPVEVDIASEFRYRDPIIDDRTLIIVISQSGETADTLAVLRDGKKKGARVIAVTNVVGSSVSREADDVLYTLAGPEIGVASTKAYLTQLIAMYTMALHMASLRKSISCEELEKIKAELISLPDKINLILDKKEEIQRFAAKHYMEKDIFFLGRGLDYAVSLEASLKLKELSYIHSEAYAGGELKHGPIALIEKGTVVITTLTQEDLMDKMVSNIREVTTRGANVFAITYEGNKDLEKVMDSVIYIPKTIDLLAPVLSIVPLQLLAYYIAVQKGCDVDKPRNLAKSVTVE